jgi:hypothetical protein
MSVYCVQVSNFLITSCNEILDARVSNTSALLGACAEYFLIIGRSGIHARKGIEIEEGHCFTDGVSG